MSQLKSGHNLDTTTKLLAWLNAPRIHEVSILRGEPESVQQEKREALRQSVSREHVEDLLEDLLDFRRFSSYRQNAKGRFALREMRRRINLQLEDCVTHPRLDDTAPGEAPRTSRIPALGVKDFQGWSPEQIEDWQRLVEAKEMVLWASEHCRVRRCAHQKCERWFEAIDPRQKFCCVNCKKRDFEQNPRLKAETKIRHRKYMRKHRKVLKDLELAAKLRATALLKKGKG